MTSGPNTTAAPIMPNFCRTAMPMENTAMTTTGTKIIQIKVASQ